MLGEAGFNGRDGAAAAEGGGGGADDLAGLVGTSVVLMRASWFFEAMIISAGIPVYAKTARFSDLPDNADIPM
jgi:hypothetical protein